VLKDGVYILGREVEALERRFADLIIGGVAHGIGVATGTDAIADSDDIAR
jgi:dTDP-4-amino-4,6-dideoxygalactose transaminase